MKRTLLIAGLLINSFFTVNAQVLQADNFNTLTVGNIGTNLTGTVAGQGGWFTSTTNGIAPTTATNSSAANFQVVASGQSTSNGLKIVSTNGDKGSRLMWKDGLDVAWAARTSGNNIIQLEYDFYTGAASTSTSQNGVRIYGPDGTNVRTLAGFVYTPSTKVLTGVAYLNNAGTLGTYLINLAAAPVTLVDNTWYSVGVAYNTTTGAVTWKGPGFDNVGLNVANYTGPFQPDDVNFISVTPATNTSFAELTYDNYRATATPTVNLLGKSDFEVVSKLSVYPNPTSGLVTISNDNNSTLQSVSISDLNGRTVKSLKLNGESTSQINISDLSAGVYMMNISSDQGSVTKKIVKN